MTSWLNKDLYVAYGFGSSNVNGYYFPSTEINIWDNSINTNISLVYSGNHWWSKEKNISNTFLKYFYGAEDDGSGICNNLTFYSNSVYGICSGELPIGNIIYSGVLAESSSSSSSSSSESSDSQMSSSSSSSYLKNLSTSSSSTESIPPINNTMEVFNALVVQGHHDFIPFSFSVSSGISNANILGFSYTKESNKLKYDQLFSFNSISSQNTSVFVPEDEESKYKHDPIFYADIIVEGQGVSKYSLRSQQEIYGIENPTNTFNIPKFTWDNSIFGETMSSETEIDIKSGYVWIGTNDKFIKKISFNSDSIKEILTISAPSEVHMITFGKNETYVSCYDHLDKYTTTSYFQGKNLQTTDDFSNDKEILNENDDLIVLDDKQSGYLISVETYYGKVIFRDRNTLNIIVEYDGFDAPFKVIWSKAHNCYLVSGTNTLWKLSNGVKTAVYNAKGYSIVDFDCSERGIICILFSGNDNIIRVLDKNLYTMLYNEKTNKTVRYCKYCEEGKFYIHLEVNNGSNYKSSGYLFDSNKKTMIKGDFESSIVTTTTTTTPTIPVSKVTILSPISTEILQKGETYVIKWNSNASVKDVVKIELYKGITFIAYIAEETENTGVYSWDIPTEYVNGEDYKIKITWIQAGNLTNYDEVNSLSLTDIPLTTTTTTVKISEKSIGIGYNKDTRQVIVVLSNGLMGFYDVDSHLFNGLLKLDTFFGNEQVNCMAINDNIVRKFRGVSKARVYVGSESYLNDKWDSGEIETNLSSIYYGGGDNLVPGEKYYVNIQVYSDQYGWSDVQSKEFIMPR